jgi:hypothetical protein
LLTGWGAGALTVAGQWRTFTAFPNILTIVELGRRTSGSDYTMETSSMA